MEDPTAKRKEFLLRLHMREERAIAFRREKQPFHSHLLIHVSLRALRCSNPKMGAK